MSGSGGSATFKLNQDAIRQVLKSQQAFDAVYLSADRVCQAANSWAASYPRSGKHPAEAHDCFVVVAEESRNRARATIRPACGFSTWLVMQEPGRFMAIIDSGRR